MLMEINKLKKLQIQNGIKEVVTSGKTKSAKLPTCEKKLKKSLRLGMVHTFKPSSREAEADRLLIQKPAWSTEQDPGQPSLGSE